MALPFPVDGTWCNGSTFDAGDLRLADAALVGQAGISSGLAVSVDGSDVVTITPGTVVISGEDAVAGTGVYRAGTAANVTGSLAARDATNGRIDLVVFRQLDLDVVGAHGLKISRIEIIAGTPSATPAVPTRPSMAVELARITVPASGGGSASADSSQRVQALAIGVPNVAKVRKSANESVTSSTTLQNDDHLLFTVTAGATYLFSAVLYVDSPTSGANGDIAVGFSFPSGTFNFTGTGPNNADLTAGSSSNGEFIARMGALTGTTTIPFAVSQTNGVVIGVQIAGDFVATANGTVRMMWAQNSSSSAATRVLAGSWIRAERVG